MKLFDSVSPWKTEGQVKKREGWMSLSQLSLEVVDWDLLYVALILLIIVICCSQ